MIGVQLAHPEWEGVRVFDLEWLNTGVMRPGALVCRNVGGEVHG